MSGCLKFINYCAINIPFRNLYYFVIRCLFPHEPKLATLDNLPSNCKSKYSPTPYAHRTFK